MPANPLGLSSFKSAVNEARVPIIDFETKCSLQFEIAVVRCVGDKDCDNQVNATKVPTSTPFMLIRGTESFP